MPGISTISIDEMPTWLVFKKYILCWHQNLQKFTMKTDNPQEWQDKFKAALRKYLNTHSFYSADEIFMFHNYL